MNSALKNHISFLSLNTRNSVSNTFEKLAIVGGFLISFSNASTEVVREKYSRTRVKEPRSFLSDEGRHGFIDSQNASMKPKPLIEALRWQIPPGTFEYAVSLIVRGVESVHLSSPSPLTLSIK